MKGQEASGTASRIRVEPPRQQGARVRLEGELLTAAGKSHRIFFEFIAPDDRPCPLRVRPFLFAFLLPAMSAGAPLELEFPIDQVTLDNVMEWQEAMAGWNPQTLKVIPIRAPRAAQSEPPRAAGALTAFSGGVDSNFTAWRHTRNPATDLFRKAPLKAGLMVHGFDIPLEREQEFERAWNISREMLGAFGLDAYRLKTNLRSLDKLPGCTWGPNAHGIWLAAALSCFEPWFGQILIPSTYAYPKLGFPWGSNPVTDPLFSSAMTAYWHDGAAFNKLEKMQAIAAEPSVQKHLRVCWQGDPVDRNCGGCFKCAATQVCFQLCGVERAETFPKSYTSAQLARIEVKNDRNEWLIRELRDKARRQGRHEIASALHRALLRAKINRCSKKIKLALHLTRKP